MITFCRRQVIGRIEKGRRMGTIVPPIDPLRASKSSISSERGVSGSREFGGNVSICSKGIAT